MGTPNDSYNGCNFTEPVRNEYKISKPYLGTTTVAAVVKLLKWITMSSWVDQKRTNNNRTRGFQKTAIGHFLF